VLAIVDLLKQPVTVAIVIVAIEYKVPVVAHQDVTVQVGEKVIGAQVGSQANENSNQW